MSAFIIISVSIIIFILLIWSLTTTCPINESWDNYQYSPQYNINTGMSSNSNSNSNVYSNIYSGKPIGYYKYPIYRQPLNWPVCHIVDEYQEPRCRSDNNVNYM